MTTEDYIQIIKDNKLLCLIWYSQDCPLFEVKALVENTYSSGECMIVKEDKIKISSINYIVLRPENDAHNVCGQDDYKNIKTISLTSEFVIDIYLHECDIPIWDD